MGKRISVILIVVRAAAAVTFGVLWQSARGIIPILRRWYRQARTRHAAVFGLSEKGDDGDYWGGVAAFHTFQQAHILLTEGTSQAADRVFCSEVYGALLLKPELAKAHMAEVIEVMELLAQDVTDANAYVRMAKLGNALGQ